MIFLRCAHETVFIKDQKDRVMNKHYESVYQRSRPDPTNFWRDVAEDVQEFRKRDEVLDISNAPFYRESQAVSSLPAVTPTIFIWSGSDDIDGFCLRYSVMSTAHWLSYEESCHQTLCFTVVLSSLGVSLGDRVIIYMLMVSESVVVAFPCVHFATIHLLVIGRFTLRELASRIDGSGATVVVVNAPCGVDQNGVTARDGYA